MRKYRPKAMIVGGLVLVGGLLSACDALRDSEPFTAAVTYEQQPDGSIVVEPPEILADNSFGQIQVDNQTDCRRGFAIDDLAVYEEIPARQVRTVSVDEARDGRTYQFYDHCDDVGCGCETTSAIAGQMRVEYRPEEFR